MLEFKECPQCGQSVFADMDVCFECLYEFPAAREDPLEDMRSVHEHGCNDAALSLRICTNAVDVTVPLAKEGLVVGRGSDADIVLHDPAVSRAHVRILPNGDGAKVQDLGARNRATVDEREVTGELDLSYGQTLLICGSAFTLGSPSE